MLTLESGRRDLIAARQHLLRFPVLHHFHPRAGQFVLGVVEGNTILRVVARFRVSGQADPDVRALQGLARTHAVLRRYAVLHGHDRASA